MERHKFNVVMKEDENGKPVRKFVPDDSPKEMPFPAKVHPYPVSGAFLTVEKEEVQEAKANLLKGLIRLVEMVAEDDDFWEVKELDENTVTIGWKVHFPTMDGSEEPIILGRK